MYDVIKDNMECVNVAKAAMEKAGITPLCDPIRGGTDGSKISFMGIPTPNIFTGVENLHGRHEFACIDDMKKAVEVIVNIVNIENNRLRCNFSYTYSTRWYLRIFKY